MPGHSHQQTPAPAPTSQASPVTSAGGPSNSELASQVDGGEAGLETPTLDLAGPTEWGGALLRRGSRGDEVSALQRGLNQAGQTTEVDGAFGRGTKSAVRGYQAQAGLSVDGIAGPETEAALNGRALPSEGSRARADDAGPEAAVEADAGGSGSVDETSFFDTLKDWFTEAVGQSQQGEGEGAQVDAEGGKQATGAAADGRIQDAVAEQAQGKLPGEAKTGQSVPATEDAEALAWIQKAGDATSLYPPDLKKQYDRCVSLAKKGQLKYPGSGTKEQQAPYRRFIRMYKAWLKERFGQQERRINKEIVKLGGSKARALNINKYIASRLKPVPDAYSNRGGMRVLDKAAASIAEMGAAAAADGVSLKVQSSYRKPKNSKPSNTAAVAANSSHSYGLAIDLVLSDKSQNFHVTEIKTGDAKNLMKYFGSPVTKWMMANGAKYGWHPYANEPWHFEYNPDGMAAEIVQGALG